MSQIPERFGLLLVDRDIVFEGGTAKRVPEYPEVLKWVESYRHRDGFIYPPMTSTRSQSEPNGKWHAVPHSERPAHLHRIPSTHVLAVDLAPLDAQHRADESFLVQLLGYLFGARLQLECYAVDGRVRVTGSVALERNTARTYATSNGMLCFTEERERAFLSHAYRTWRNWPPQDRALMTNILYMYSRTSSYEWEWEYFAFEFMVFDALYRLSTRVAGVPEGKHSERYDRMRTRFDLADDREVFRRIYGLRNALFHEALWDHTMPGYGGAGIEAVYATQNLHHLNNRLVPAVLGFPTLYITLSCTSRDGGVL